MRSLRCEEGPRYEFSVADQRTETVTYIARILRDFGYLQRISGPASRARQPINVELSRVEVNSDWLTVPRCQSGTPSKLSEVSLNMTKRERQRLKGGGRDESLRRRNERDVMQEQELRVTVFSCAGFSASQFILPKEQK